MEPGTPFALLAAVQLFSVACCLAVAGGWLLPGLRGPRSGVVALGAALLAAAETASGVTLGDFQSTGQFVIRVVAGALLIGGALGRGRSRRLAVIGGVFVSIVGALTPVLHQHPVWILAGRAVGGLILVSAVVGAIRRSVLGKVVAAILIGVVITSVGAAVVAGTALSRSFLRQQASEVASLAATQRNDIVNLRQTSLQFAKLIGSRDLRFAQAAAGILQGVTSERGFTVAVQANGTPLRLDTSKTLDTAALLDLAHSQVVQTALGSLTKAKFEAPDFIVVRGKTSLLLAAGVHAAPGATPNAKAPFAVVYAIPIDSSRLRLTFARSGIHLTVLSVPDGAVIASTLPNNTQRVAVARQAASTVAGPPPQRVVVSHRASGSRAAIAYATIQSGTEPVAIIVATQAADVVARTQRLVLAGLFGALVGIAVLLTGLAVVLGRRVVEPIHRLTDAASQIRLGNLSVVANTDSRDEIGELSRAFNEMTSSLTDATSRLQVTAAQEAATRARLQTVLDSMGDPLLVIAPNGEVAEANPAAVALLGAYPVGLRADAVLAGPDATPLLRAPSGSTQELTTGDRTLMVQLSVAALPSNAGRVVVIRDVSAQIQIERMKTEFLSNISHELRTPLTPIKGYAEMIHRRELPKEQVKTFAGTILDSTRRMTRVVELLVDVASLEAGRVQPRLEEVRAAEVVDELTARWSTREPKRAKDLRRRVSKDLPAVEIDKEWLSKALDEVVGNAIKFSKPGSLVTVSATAAPRTRWVRFTVKDKGIGMSAADLSAIVDDFSQVDGSATRRSEGLGLGLGFVRRLAPVLGFELTIESVVGKGTSVHLDMPQARGRRRRH